MGREVAAQPLLPAADLEQDRVLVLGPAEREAQLLEGLVEGDEVAVALGVGQHAVAVEDERPVRGVTPGVTVLGVTAHAIFPFVLHRGDVRLATRSLTSVPREAPCRAPPGPPSGSPWGRGRTGP